MAPWEFAVFAFFCACVFFFDLVSRRVPNWMILFALASRALFLVWSTDAAWQASGTGAVVALALFLPFYVFRAMGAGDVKYFVAVGFWLGPAALLVVWIGGSLIAGLHALATVFVDRMPWATTTQVRLQRVSDWVRAKRNGRHGIPYAAYMAVAAMAWAVERLTA